MAVPRTLFGGSSVGRVSTVRIVVLAALGLLVLSGAAFGLPRRCTARSQTRTVITNPVRKIVVHGDAGDVAVRAGLTGDVIVQRKDAWTVDRPSISERFADGVLTIRDRLRRADAPCCAAAAT